MPVQFYDDFVNFILTLVLVYSIGSVYLWFKPLAFLQRLGLSGVPSSLYKSKYVFSPSSSLNSFRHIVV